MPSAFFNPHLPLRPHSSLWPANVQVHRAVLHSGEQVVVKVQRPGLQRLFDIDLAQLRTVAAQLDAMEEGRDFTGIYAECEAILRQEIDYIIEGRSANRCAEVVSDDMLRLTMIS